MSFLSSPVLAVGVGSAPTDQPTAPRQAMSSRKFFIRTKPTIQKMEFGELLPKDFELLEFLRQNGWRLEWFGHLGWYPDDLEWFGNLGWYFEPPDRPQDRLAIFHSPTLNRSFPVVAFDGEMFSSDVDRTVRKHVVKIKGALAQSQSSGIGGAGEEDSVDGIQGVLPTHNTTKPNALLRRTVESSTDPSIDCPEIVVAINDAIRQEGEAERSFAERVSSDVRKSLTNSALLLMHGRAALALAVLENLDKQV